MLGSWIQSRLITFSLSSFPSDKENKTMWTQYRDLRPNWIWGDRPYTKSTRLLFEVIKLIIIMHKRRSRTQTASWLYVYNRPIQRDWAHTQASQPCVKCNSRTLYYRHMLQQFTPLALLDFSQAFLQPACRIHVQSHWLTRFLLFWLDSSLFLPF